MFGSEKLPETDWLMAVAYDKVNEYRCIFLIYNL
jgi:hypothetical protein